MSIFGYDPARYHTGRAPIEAAALGLKLRPDQVAYRCNLSTIGDDGTMIDFAGGHPSTERAAAAIEAMHKAFADEGIEFHRGVQYRHIMVAPADWAEAECAPPHDLTGKPLVWPTGPAASKLQRVMDASRDILADFDIDANTVWLWGQGFQPQMPSFESTYGIKAGLVTAVDLVRGLGVLTGEPHGRVFHGDLGAQIAIDPFHRGTRVRDGTFGDQVVDVVGPVLDRRVPAPPALAHNDLHHSGVQ
jgi:2,3-bisphosphoglycerate-independent phosphoglycerate mutase